MAESRPVYVSLTSFGAAEVRRHGQAWFARLCHAAGADGVEVRGELLQGHEDELDELSAIVADAAVACVYSSPLGLWTPDGEFAAAAVREGLARAQVLGAATLKMSLGGFRAHSSDGWQALKDLLAGSAVQLLAENDQQAGSGSQPAFEAFFQAVDAHHLPVGMTFDIGNWHWLGESPLEMARLFAKHVRYVHCKGVFRRPDKWVAVPMQASIAPWRTLLRALPPGVPRAIEHPLVGDDLVAVTREALDLLRHAD